MPVLPDVFIERKFQIIKFQLHLLLLASVSSHRIFMERNHFISTLNKVGTLMEFCF
jgi:hypothetical protein